MRSGYEALNDKEKAQVVQAREDGMTYLDIAKRFGCSVDLVNLLCLNAGLPGGRFVSSDENERRRNKSNKIRREIR